MENKAPGVWSLVKIPAIVTLIVTVLRLVGELQGWDESLFGRGAGGGGALIGISWLVPIFGLWFGWQARRVWGAPKKLGRAFLIIIAVLALTAAVGFALHQTGVLVIPDQENPTEPPQGVEYIILTMALGSLVALGGLGKLGALLFLYGLLARIPVIIVTYFAVQNDWNTHYNKLPPGVTTESQNELLLGLIMPQVVLWIPFTILIGGLFGCISAAMAGKQTQPY